MTLVRPTHGYFFCATSTHVKTVRRFCACLRILQNERLWDHADRRNNPSRVDHGYDEYGGALCLAFDLSPPFGCPLLRPPPFLRSASSGTYNNKLARNTVVRPHHTATKRNGVLTNCRYARCDRRRVSFGQCTSCLSGASRRSAQLATENVSTNWERMQFPRGQGQNLYHLRLVVSPFAG